jgi:hypothetical protein
VTVQDGSSFGDRGCGMKVDKPKFDTLLGKVDHTKPVPRTSIKATGRRDPKTPKLPAKS